MVLEKLANHCKIMHEYCQFCTNETELYNREAEVFILLPNIAEKIAQQDLQDPHPLRGLPSSISHVPRR